MPETPTPNLDLVRRAAADFTQALATLNEGQLAVELGNARKPNLATAVDGLDAVRSIIADVLGHVDKELQAFPGDYSLREAVPHLTDAGIAIGDLVDALAPNLRAAR